MLDIGLIMGIVGLLTEILKQKVQVDKLYLPILILGLGAALNGLNAYAFGGNVVVAVKEGIYAAAAMAGIYSMAKTALVAKEKAL